MGKHSYSRYRRYRAKVIAKEVGFWMLVALSVLFMYVFFFWERAW